MMRKTRTLLAVLALMLAVSGIGRAETLLFASDLHLTEDRESHVPALNVLSTAAQDCDALILLGDSTNNAHDAEHEYVLEFLRSVDAPAYVVPGNHDLARELRPSAFSRMYGDYGWNDAFSRDGASAGCAVMTAGGTCLLLIDTNAFSDIGSVQPLGGISEATLQWVDEVLQGLEPGTPVIACGHHPILPAESRSTPNADRLADALRRGGVKLYLCGHDHGFAAIEIDGLQQITVGQPQAFPGWAGTLTVEADGFQWKVLPLYRPDDPAWIEMSERAAGLGLGIGRGILDDSPFAGNEAAAQWFARCFDLMQRSELTPEICLELLSDPAAETWRAVETRTVVRDWLFGFLENCPQDVRAIRID